MSNFSIAKTYAKMAGQLSQVDADPAAAVDDALELARQIQAALADQWKANVTAMPTTEDEAAGDDLAQRLEYIADWLDFHDRAITMGVRSATPSALIVQKRSVEVVTARFTLESIEAMEAAMQQFESLNFTGGVIYPAGHKLSR